MGRPLVSQNTAMVSLVSVSHYLPLQAKEMVELSRSIANKIKDKQGDITEDEVSLKTLRGLIALLYSDWLRYLTLASQ